MGGSQDCQSDSIIRKDPTASRSQVATIVNAKMGNSIANSLSLAAYGLRHVNYVPKHVSMVQDRAAVVPILMRITA